MKRADLEQIHDGFRAARLGVAALLFATLLAGVLASGALPFPTLSPRQAEAVDATYVAQPNTTAQSSRTTEIEQLTDAYNAARATAIRADVNVALNQKRIAGLEAKIPVEQKRSDDSMRMLYKLQEDRYQVMEMLLSSKTLEDFIQQSEYIERINRTNLKTINRLNDMYARLDKARENLASVKAEADAVMHEATDALNAAKAARAAKAASGIANAQGQAVSMGGEASVGKDGDGKDQPEDFKIAASTDTGALADGADWYMSEEEFINTWASRINAYLAGSALDGQGENFARSAWRYCVDPRWSPAISNTESSKGAICIRPHNAWGWGAADSNPYGLASEWGSWEEAIDAHVRGLANGYGYTITISGAKAYCPGTWQSWYNNTLSEMARI